MELMGYIVIGVIGALYAYIREKYNYDIPWAQKLHLDLPGLLLFWGLLGSYRLHEPLAFIIAFSGSLSFGIFYLIINETEELYQQSIGKIAVVDIPIKPDAKGQIILQSENGNEYFVAENFGDLIKPIPRKTRVMIHSFTGVIAQVYEIASNPLKIPKREINKYSKILEYFKKSRKGTCMICFGKVESHSIKCPNCKQVAHHSHLASWLTIRDNCPNCKSYISLEGEQIKLREVLL